ncbi:MAG: thioredoxin [Candidatus Muirbacterium halophilum]|nr:thioredoxin [Candidatus Muirbacterium halophilum]MCK9474888.1 thioredoxin [Candidatus Muirbacterium halophilum]
MAKVLNDNEFNALLKSEKILVVDFGAEWCGPCKMIAPIIDELSIEYKEKATIAKVDVDKSPDLSRKYGISGVPTILFFKDGELVKNQVGFLDKEQLKQHIDSL